MRTEGIAEQLRLPQRVKAEVDEGYRGLANEFPDQVTAPPKKPKDDVPEGDRRAWREMRRRQSRRIVVEHANAEMRQWRLLQRYTGRRKDYAESHRAARRTTSRTVRRARPNLNRRPSRYRHVVPALGHGRAPQLLDSRADDLALLPTAVPGHPVTTIPLGSGRTTGRAPTGRRARHPLPRCR
ncbi:hypothetical protein GCM10027074_75760 [Streptomyces deserti]